MDDLLAISGDEWMELDAEEWIADECCGAVVDDDIIPADMDGAIADAAASGIQMIVGTNNDEWNYFQEDSEGETAKEKFASWVEGMDAMYEEAWTNFAKDGNPSIEGAEWLAYNTSDRQTMVIEKDKWECVSDPSKTARELLEKAYGDEPYPVW